MDCEAMGRTNRSVPMLRTHPVQGKADVPLAQPSSLAKSKPWASAQVCACASIWWGKYMVQIAMPRYPFMHDVKLTHW